MAASEPTLDVLIWPQMLKLRQCLRDQIAARGLAEVCCVFMSPGAIVDFSSEKDFAWVNLLIAEPAAPAVQNCGTPLAANVEVGIMRCIPVRRDGRLLTAEEHGALTAAQLADMAAIRAAVTCCGVEGARLLTYTPRGPEGGIYGGAWTATIEQADL